MILFIISINDFIKLVKESCDVDGYLRWLHLLVLMDDTVLLSTTRRGIQEKLELLNQYCHTHQTKVNNSKTKFFVVNGSAEDRQPFIMELFTVGWCDSYVYLGSIFTSDGNTSSAIKEHAVAKASQTFKFVQFIRKNQDIPFCVKLRVFHACILSSLLYGCESWLTGDTRPVARLYNTCIKTLLGVRSSTCNDICYVELGLPPIKATITLRQRSFVRNMWRTRSGLNDDPWTFAMQIARGARNVTSRHLENLLTQDINDVDMANEDTRRSIVTSISSRRTKYTAMNPTLSVHPIYNQQTASPMGEVHRLSFTKMRVSAHSLAIETGRWNRGGRGRLPVEERLCRCGAVQDELHVLEACPETEHLRQEYGFRTYEELIAEDSHFSAPEIIHKILAIFE